MQNTLFGPLVRAFFFLIVFFFKNSFLSTRTIGAMVLQMDTQEATMRKMNPNDVNHVVWAISTCFFFFTNLYLQVLYVLWSY